MYAAGRAAEEHGNVTALLTKSRHVRGASFNINAYSQHQCMDFRFTNVGIGRICGLINWVGITTRNECRYEPIAATCMMLHRLATTIRWYDIEMKFGVFSSQINEMLWGALEMFTSDYGNLLELGIHFAFQ